ncbi:hypothetical protein HBH95_151250 [Parastagonospora nodorum]|nr:hypothetical protein HBH95_151250 [Parastagonospora nodorum]KAH6211556.1 hypothetical protein HBI53_113150 [Parastagonospora nodorum]
MPGGIQPPIEELLSWPVPNYIDPPTKSKYILIVACVLGPISIILLLARLWVRIRLQRNAGLDDWLMLASLFPMIAMTVLDPLVVEKYQFNRHIWDVEYDYFPIQRKFVMAIYALFTLASGLVKMSVLLFYRRLSSRSVSPTFRWTMRIMMVVVGGYTIAFILRSNTATRQGPSALVSKSSAWIPIMFLRSSYSTNSNGYISESNTNIMTDKHGGIVKMNTFGQSDSQRRDSDSLSDPSGPEYKDLILSPLSHGPDVEMGLMRDSHMSNISALPPIHAPPPSPMWLRPLQSLSSRSRQ